MPFPRMRICLTAKRKTFRRVEPGPGPLWHAQDLETFRSRHGGRTTFRLTDLDDSWWKAITGKTVLPATP